MPNGRALVAMLALLVGVAAVSAARQDPLPGRAEAASPPPVPATSTTAASTATTTEVTPTSFTLGTIDLLAVDADADLSDATRTSVQSLLDRYLNDAVVTPLRSGQPVGDLSSVFSGAALERLDGPDRAALVDEGLPAAVRVKVANAQADLTALVARGGATLMIAGITIVVTGEIDGATLTVERTGELLLDGEGEDWRVTGYSVRVSRNSDKPVTATTVAR